MHIEKDKLRIRDFIMNLNANIKYFSNQALNCNDKKSQENLDFLIESIFNAIRNFEVVKNMIEPSIRLPEKLPEQP